MKNIAILALSVLSISVARAQVSKDFRLGAKIGATYSSISGDNVSQIAGPNFNSDLGNYKWGYNAGFTANVPISSDGFFSLQPELLYNRKGYEVNSKQTSNLPNEVSAVEFKQQRVLHYLDVPILARINAGGLFFELGPQMSFLFGSTNKQQTTTRFSNGTNDKVEDNGSFQDFTGIARGDKYKSDLTQFDISGVAGIGFMTEGGLSLDLRYARGFHSLLDTKNVTLSQNPKAFNNVFTLQLGYLLPFGQ
ncbi:porin family protein [Hymenobacter sp. BT770]|uniref:porin family protein n=1 Tax=Hymenobacter sp. BT770 TaxID=2886942 RepID=UPI001D114692|nr:porin family protein [Hymenobacter sp. BT770]MCC3154840.1 PorT family protein [Hymenobacter sp. BT770]MDO3416785.1 porin family protein [Hymenobacter sp. BT770]